VYYLHHIHMSRCVQVIAAYVLGLVGLAVRIYFWGKADDKRRAQLALEAESKPKTT
jgi:hypothetical protein